MYAEEREAVEGEEQEEAEEGLQDDKNDTELMIDEDDNGDGVKGEDDDRVMTNKRS